jgi:hypothetical protein
MADKDDEKDGEESGTARDELFEAIDHLKNAANILFDRAAKDPTVRSATKEAAKVVKNVGDAAEPLAKQLTGELSKLTKNVLEAVDGKKKSEAPPPKGSDDDKK